MTTTATMVEEKTNRLFFKALFRKPDLKTVTGNIDDCDQEHPDETPEMIEQGLRDLQAELDKIPDGEKRCYREALEKCPHIVNDPAFRLLFLRTDVYQSPLSARRFVTYWEKRVDLFGSEKAFLDLKDAIQDDMETLRDGYIRCVNDGDGRLFVVDPSRTSRGYNVDSIARAFHFTSMVALRNSEEMQKKGSAVVLDLKKIRTFDYKRVADVNNNGFPMRNSLSCIINPPPLVNVFVSVFKLFVKPRLRKRIKVADRHEQLKKYVGLTVGEVMELVDHDAWIQQNAL